MPEVCVNLFDVFLCDCPGTCTETSAIIEDVLGCVFWVGLTCVFRTLSCLSCAAIPLPSPMYMSLQLFLLSAYSRERELYVFLRSGVRLYILYYEAIHHSRTSNTFTTCAPKRCSFCCEPSFQLAPTPKYLRANIRIASDAIDYDRRRNK